MGHIIATTFLESRYYPEEFSYTTLINIYTCYTKILNNDESQIGDELDGSKYKTYFERHFELLNIS